MRGTERAPGKPEVDVPRRRPRDPELVPPDGRRNAASRSIQPVAIVAADDRNRLDDLIDRVGAQEGKRQASVPVQAPVVEICGPVRTDVNTADFEEARVDVNGRHEAVAVDLPDRIAMHERTEK